jgi:hypothetical protein
MGSLDSPSQDRLWGPKRSGASEEAECWFVHSSVRPSVRSFIHPSPQILIGTLLPPGPQEVLGDLLSSHAL